MKQFPIILLLSLLLAACGGQTGTQHPEDGAEEAGDSCVDASEPLDQGDPEDAGDDHEYPGTDRAEDGDHDDAGDNDAADASDQDESDGGDSSTGCAGYSAGVEVGTIDNFRLLELSGITASRINPDVLWTHNDGSEEKLYAVGTTADFLGIFNLLDINTGDFEDIAVGPGPAPDTTYIYIGDIGNNGRDRQRMRVWRVPEPTIPAPPFPFEADLTGIDELMLDYPDARHDSETLLVDPETQDIYLVTKAYEPPTILFRAPAPIQDGEVVVLEPMTTINLGDTPELALATGGDVNPAGDTIIIRTKFTAFIWHREPGTPFHEAFASEPCTITLKLELTGEAAGFAQDGMSFYTT
ncbi:hypothetical protein ACFL2F_05275, partial [Myxococcota bacterium]